MITVCANCFKMKNAVGEWLDVGYIKEDTQCSNFSHGICPDCAKELYPEYADDTFQDD